MGAKSETQPRNRTKLQRCFISAQSVEASAALAQAFADLAWRAFGRPTWCPACLSPQSYFANWEPPISCVPW
jgi:hypothetical protein